MLNELKSDAGGKVSQEKMNQVLMWLGKNSLM